MKKFFYVWKSPYLPPPRWMGFVMFSARRNERLWAVFPLNVLLALAWWVQDRWARAALAPSWIEREVQDRMHVAMTGEQLKKRDVRKEWFN
jgi:hypothetical protein